MKTGRRITLKSDSLRKIRTNLRKFFYGALGDYHDKLMDQWYMQNNSGNIEGANRLEKSINSSYDLLYTSICKCHDCGSFEKDAVFFSEKVYYPMYYPPIDSAIERPRIWWLCPECYQQRMKKLDRLLKEGYYYFRDIGTTATLEQLGYRTFDEYLRSLD